MRLPEYVLRCMELLERSGAQCYAVGGCVRDALLGLTPHDYDLCTDFTPERTKAVFRAFPLVLAGEKHGTVGVVLGRNVVEITTFRTEGSYQDSRHPDWVAYVGSLEEDLSRRDFTVNAMAYHPARGVIDPFGGGADLKSGCLRAVGEPEKRFREDALRILRGVRFAVRFGLTPEKETEKAMVSQAYLLDHLARERVFEELCGILPRITADDLVRYAPVITRVIPELKAALGFDQRNPHHVYDIYTHIAKVVEAVPAELTLRWAALLHDVGKMNTFTVDDRGVGHFYGHARESARLANDILLRLKAPTALREQVVFLVDKHMMPLPEDRKLLKRSLAKYGSGKMKMLLALRRGDCGSKGSGGEDDRWNRVEALIRDIEAENGCLSLKDLAVKGNDLMALGFQGRSIGETLDKLLELVVDEQVENEKDALLRASLQYKGGKST